MAAAFARRGKKPAAQTKIPLHPNDIDRKRIERALAGRARYRYVTPRVSATDSGYRIISPCCSRNIDKTGGEIDIALIEFMPERAKWRLSSRNHANQSWDTYGEFLSLPAVLAPLLEDAERRFWQ
jgi:hypothetical protein